MKLAIKTVASEGMIWFVGSTKADPDYSTLYLAKGKIVFQNNLGKLYSYLLVQKVGTKTYKV